MSQAHRKSHRKKLEEAQDDEILNEFEDDPLLSLGNQGVQKIVAAKQAQAKLRVSQTGDPQEREADRIAEQVMKGPSSSAAAQDPARQLVDRVLAKASRVITGGGVSEAQVKGLKGHGEPLKPKDRQFFENRFGADFSHVKIHTNRKAAGLAESINARAFTYGESIAFAPGEYKPDTRDGKKLIAHELTHVVQQGKSGEKSVDREERAQGPVSNNPVPSPIPNNSNIHLERTRNAKIEAQRSHLYSDYEDLPTGLVGDVRYLGQEEVLFFQHILGSAYRPEFHSLGLSDNDIPIIGDWINRPVRTNGHWMTGRAYSVPHGYAYLVGGWENIAYNDYLKNWTGIPSRVSNSNIRKAAVMIHELFHQVQYQLSWDAFPKVATEFFGSNQYIYHQSQGHNPRNPGSIDGIESYKNIWEIENREAQAQFVENFTVQYLEWKLRASPTARSLAGAFARVLECSGFYSEAIHAVLS
jgi:hypothetical protein